MKNFKLEKDLTPDEKQRLWKFETEPVRKILLWGFDSHNNPCLLIMYGVQEFEQKVHPSSYSYYEYHLLKPVVTYTRYAVFHGLNGHLPSIPNTYYVKEDNLVCYIKGYKTAYQHWDYDRRTNSWNTYREIDKKYIIKNSYDMEQDAEFNYYTENTYPDYVSYLQSNNITFKDLQLIGNPSSFFGFEPDSPYMETIINMFSKERLYSRKKYLSQFIKMQPSAEEYGRILKVASVELACGIFQELAEEKNPVLLETARRLLESNTAWAQKTYHNGLKRFLEQYISMFDNKLMQKRKEFIYRTLPEMDFHIKELDWGEKLSGSELEEYLSTPHAYQDIVYSYGKVYEKNTYMDGHNIYNIQFKNTIQMAKVYGMADAIGKIAYYLDTPRNSGYFKGSGRAGAYNYYKRYIRRILDGYRAADEQKFITAAREMLTSYTDNDSMDMYDNPWFQYNFFFSRYFVDVILNRTVESNAIWNRYIDDIVYIAKNSKATPVHEFCYIILKEAAIRREFDTYGIKELAEASKIPYNETARLFIKLLFPKLDALQEFDSEIMLALMDSQSEDLWNAAKKYFKRTNGKFSPEDITSFLFLDTIEIWYSILEDNINNFTLQEYITFIKSLASRSDSFIKQDIKLSGQAAELLQYPLSRLDAAPEGEKLEFLRYLLSLLLNFGKFPAFLLEIAESIVFSMPYDVLKSMLDNVNLQHGRITEKEYNQVSLLKSVKEDALPKDNVILSVLETGTPGLVKTLAEIAGRLKAPLAERTTTLLLLFECNVNSLNKTAQSVFEGMETAEREKMHMLLLDSPVERAYRYGLEKLDAWYGDKLPGQFILRMMEHPCTEVKAFLSEKIQKAFTSLKDVNPDFYIYYFKTLLYLPNKVSKNKEYLYNTVPVFLKYFPGKQEEIENILLDIGSANSKINSERALVAYASIQKEASSLWK
ncbi:MAG: hypothetical protein HFH68_06200 [Lachnospiraceae bacterium]|nr:hypothetical protein [Lachnospiraceae bacterium]